MSCILLYDAYYEEGGGEERVSGLRKNTLFEKEISFVSNHRVLELKVIGKRLGCARKNVKCAAVFQRM